MEAKILLIEDDAGAGAALRKVLRGEGHDVELCRRGDEGLARAEEEAFDLVITDFKLPGLSGLELIDRLHTLRPRLPIIMMTAHGTMETAIEATKLGACEYLTKPFEVEELLGVVDGAIRQSRLMTQPVAIGGTSAAGHGIIGNSRIMQNLYKEIGRVAATNVSVLIRGATGTGKEMVARAIYQHSHRAGQPFIAVNCAAIPRTLLESELFGHERGAFTGAANRRVGKFEQAQGGTLFLDEIGDMEPDTQAKLLRVLQEKSIQRLGGDHPIPVDVRVLAATHRDLETAIESREFREDLFYRIGGMTLWLPPLAERKEDIPELVHHFIRRHAGDLGVPDPSVLDEAVAMLQEQPWPGNVRELENVVRQALLLARPFPVGAQHVRQALDKSSGLERDTQTSHAAYVSHLLDRVEKGEVTKAYWQMITDLEPELFAQAIARAGGNQAKAARWLGITRLKMREKLSEFRIQPAREDGPEAPPTD